MPGTGCGAPAWLCAAHKSSDSCWGAAAPAPLRQNGLQQERGEHPSPGTPLLWHLTPSSLRGRGGQPRPGDTGAVLCAPPGPHLAPPRGLSQRWSSCWHRQARGSCAPGQPQQPGWSQRGATVPPVPPGAALGCGGRGALPPQGTLGAGSSGCGGVRSLVPSAWAQAPALVSLVSQAGVTVRGERERGFGVLWWCRQVGAVQRPGHPLVRLGSVTWSWSVSVPWGRGGLGPRGPVTVLGGCRGSGCGVGRGVGGPCGAGVRPAVPLHKSGSRGGRGSLLPWKPAR